MDPIASKVDPATTSLDHTGDGDYPEEETIIALISRRVFAVRLGRAELVGSVLVQLGNTVFLSLSAFLGLCAVMITTISRRLRKLDGINSERMRKLIEKTQEKVNEHMKQYAFESVAAKIFEGIDGGLGDGDGCIDPTELYCMILVLYCKASIYVPALTPITKQQSDHLFRTFDQDSSGSLNRQEFLLIASILGSNIALRIALQTCIALVMAPLLGMRCADILASYLEQFPSGSALLESCLSSLPETVQPLIGTRETAGNRKLPGGTLAT